MKLSDTDLERRDREWAERLLSKEEDLLMVLKSDPKMLKPERFQQMFFGLLFMAIPTYALLQNGENPPLLNVLMPGIFILVGLILMISPWWKYALEKRSIFLVTNRRVIHLYLSTIRRTEIDVSYELRQNVQLEVVEECKDGAGYLGFNYEDEAESLEYGGLLENVPQVLQVEKVLRAVLNDGNV